MFNPASMLKFLSKFQRTGEAEIVSHWINASANRILKDNIEKQGARFKNKLLALLDGGTITEPVFESIDYEVLDQPSHMFSLLVDTGYLCPVSRAGEDEFELKIPNKEVRYGYREMIDSIAGIKGEILNDLCASLIEGRTEKFEEKLNEILAGAASFYDFAEKENSYHNLMMGALLYVMGRFHIDSNREAGDGRYDIAMIPNERYRGKYRPIIIEFKVAQASASKEGKACSDGELLALAEEALKQIESNRYAAGFAHMYEKEDFLLVGIGAQGKRCKVTVR
jgi:hypothetical protein